MEGLLERDLQTPSTEILKARSSFESRAFVFAVCKSGLLLSANLSVGYKSGYKIEK